MLRFLSLEMGIGVGEHVDPVVAVNNAGLAARMPTLGSALIAAHRTFVGYAESLPQPGYVGCYGRGGPLFSAYLKRHVPWAFFTKAGHPGEIKKDVDHYLLDDALHQPFDAFPKPGHYDDLPTVSFVVPNMLHNTHGYAGTSTLFNYAQPASSQALERRLPDSAGVVKLKCDVHPWMAGFVVISKNPYFAVTKEDGTFQIKDVPAGTYTIEAWHEKLGTKTQQVTVTEGKPAQAKFDFSDKKS